KVIMRKRDIKSYEHKGNIIIEDLFNFYNYRDNIEFISPQLYRTLPNKINPIYQELKKRAIVDYISGMMDTFAIREWETHHKK
ncbi:deoxyguanosinetriphosphate triphosphohydrolase, partial [Escherichia coli]|nr:deoxyguanosinetriphosphate triphosphohydrolase [Escherichia coli]